MSASSPTMSATALGWVGSGEAAPGGPELAQYIPSGLLECQVPPRLWQEALLACRYHDAIPSGSDFPLVCPPSRLLTFLSVKGTGRRKMFLECLNDVRNWQEEI